MSSEKRDRIKKMTKTHRIVRHGKKAEFRLNRKQTIQLKRGKR